MMKGKYKGAELRPLLRDCTATIRAGSDDEHVLAQFDSMLVQGVVRQPGTGFDPQMPYCFGWHEFHVFDFDYERIAGHDVDCRCLECWPEPHSLDQLRRRF